MAESLGSKITEDQDFLKFSSVDLSKYWPGKDYMDPQLASLALDMARQSSRGRFIFRIHDSLSSELHLMINAVTKGNYVAPHRHEERVKTETFRILEGSAWVVFFGEGGSLKRTVMISEQGRKTVAIRPNQWHTIVSDQDFVFLESKRHPEGGYNPETDKEFAEWAPKEGDSKSAEYLNNLLKKVRSG